MWVKYMHLLKKNYFPPFLGRKARRTTMSSAAMIITKMTPVPEKSAARGMGLAPPIEQAMLVFVWLA